MKMKTPIADALALISEMEPVELLQLVAYCRGLADAKLRSNS